MSGDFDKRLSPTAKRVYGKVRLPHKFCPYCGHRNEAGAEVCENCGKDISWMKVPEPVTYTEAPKEKPRELPTQRKSFSRKAIVWIIVIAAVLVAVILVLVFTVGSKGATAVPAVIGIASFSCEAWPLDPRKTGRTEISEPRAHPGPVRRPA